MHRRRAALFGCGRPAEHPQSVHGLFDARALAALLVPDVAHGAEHLPLASSQFPETGIQVEAQLATRRAKRRLESAERLHLRDELPGELGGHDVITAKNGQDVAGDGVRHRSGLRRALLFPPPVESLA